jgi:Rrf2 family transcriptional regulator, cysteine metabolism repressor
MKISQKADYALRAMLDLALNARKGTSVPTSQISRRTRVPQKFLEAILVDLRKAGLVTSKRGPEGGHELSRAADSVTLGQIRAAVDGPLEMAVRARRRAGDPLEAGVRQVWDEVEGGIREVLERQSLAEICRRVEAARRVLDFSI